MTVEQALEELVAHPETEGPAWSVVRSRRAQAVVWLEGGLGQRGMEQQRATLRVLERLGAPPLAGLRSAHAEIVSETLRQLEVAPPQGLTEALLEAIPRQSPVNVLLLGPLVTRRAGWKALKPLFLRCHMLARKPLKSLGAILAEQLERDPGPGLGALVHSLDPGNFTSLYNALPQPWQARVQALRDGLPDVARLSAFGVILANPEKCDPEDPSLPPGYLPLHPQARESARERLIQGGHLLVVGPSGVGKTLFLRHLFADLAASQALVTLETSTGIVVAGMKYIGEWQGNLRKLVEASQRPHRVLVYFTDLMNLTSAGVSEGNTENFGSFLKPWMERGDIVLVGEATPEQMLHLRRHPDVANLFLEVVLEPPSRERMPEIIRGMLPTLDREVRLEDSVLERLVELSDLYVPARVFPGKTLDLLRRVIRERSREAGPLELTGDDLIGALAGSTGLPRWLLDDSTPMELARTRAFFDERIIGQPEGVRSVVDLITLVKAGLADPNRPLAVLFFVGPTGVGKTETAKALAEFVFGSPDRLLRFDMSEFKDYDSYQRLIGVPYGSQELSEGLLTRRVREQPFSVLLLDEFEKAHPNVYDLMLQLFDDGRLTSARGEVVSFRQTIVIMTSNLGSSTASAGSLGILHRPSEGPSSRAVMKAVEEYFRPEFLNRIQVVHFQALDLAAMQQIARRELESVLQRSGIRRRELTVDVDEAFLSLLMRQGFTPQYGARPLKRALEQLLLLPLARKLVSGPARSSLVQVHCHGEQVRVRVVEPREPPATEREIQASLGLATLREMLDETRALLRDAPEEKARLVERSHDERLWEDPVEARRVLSRIRSLEVLLEGQARLEQLVSSPRASADRGREIELWHRRLTYPDPADQREAFVSLRALDPEAPLARVEAMLVGWAERMHLDTTVLDAGLLWIAGPCAYGLLRPEHGLHRFVRKAPSGARRSSLVRVDVWCQAPDDFQPGEVRSEARRRKGGSWARALHVPSVTVAEASNALEPDENRAAMHSLLAAKLWQTPPEGALVRVYYLEPEREVRDLASGLRSHHLEAVLEGDLQAFR